MEKSQIRPFIQFELKKGTAPEVVFDMAIKKGIPSYEIKGVFMELLPYEQVKEIHKRDIISVNKNFIIEKKRERENIKNMRLDNIFWDPVNKSIKFGTFKKEREALYKKFKYLKNHSYLLKIYLFLLILIILFVWGIIGYWLYVDTDSARSFLFGDSNHDAMCWVLLLAWLPLLMFLSYIKNLQIDLIKERIAEKRKWIYNPDKSNKHWFSLKEKFPFIFAKGNKSQNVQDEIWGRYKNDDQNIDFYSGIFEFQVETGNEKRRHSKRYFQTYFGIHLNKKLNKDLKLTPNSKVKKIFKSLLSEKIELESVEFNEIYSVEYGGKKEEKLDIFKKLSPAVQWELIRLGKESKDLKILFSEDTFLFSQSGFLFQKNKLNFMVRIIIGMIPFAKQVLIRKMHSNFMKRVEINIKDEEFLEEKIETLLEIATEIPQYLD